MTCMYMYVFMSVCVYLHKHRCIYPLTPKLLKNIFSADSQLSHCQSKSDTASPCILHFCSNSSHLPGGKWLFPSEGREHTHGKGSDAY